MEKILWKIWWLRRRNSPAPKWPATKVAAQTLQHQKVVDANFYETCGLCTWSRTSWCNRVDTGQLDTTDLTLRTSWHWVRLDAGGSSWC